MASQIISSSAACSAVRPVKQQMKHKSSVFVAFDHVNSFVTGGFSSQASNAESFPMSWRHYGLCDTGLSHQTSYIDFFAVHTQTIWYQISPTAG